MTETQGAPDRDRHREGKVLAGAFHADLKDRVSNTGRFLVYLEKEGVVRKED